MGKNDVAVALLKRIVDGDWKAIEEARILFYGTCPRCGKVFERKQVNARYCSRACINVENVKNWRKSAKKLEKAHPEKYGKKA